jgi:hypothetical protein
VNTLDFAESATVMCYLGIFILCFAMFQICKADVSLECLFTDFILIIDTSAFVTLVIALYCCCYITGYIYKRLYSMDFV